MKLFKLMTLGIIDDSIPTEHGVEYFAEALKILKTRSNCCWQVKSKFVALVNKIIIISGPEAMQYNSVTADAINIACASFTATSNNEELCHLQLEGASLLYTVISETKFCLSILLVNQLSLFKFYLGFKTI